MPRTYEPIASTTLGAGGSTLVTFSNIPGTFTDLILVSASDTDYPFAAGVSTYLRINGDTAGNYSTTWLLGSGSAASSSRASNDTNGIYIGEFSGTANTQETSIVQIMSYANTNVHKTVLSSSAVASYFVTRQVGLWRSTAAITSVSVRAGGYTFQQGGTFSLYGVKAA
jgi:hypothetical protein